jgi:hypothetical protein
VLGAGALLLVVEAPPRRTGPESVRGPRVLRVRAASVRAVELRAGDHQVAAVRAPGGWQLDDRPAPPGAVDALDTLVTTLADLRAVDAFRPERGAQLGLDPPTATIALRTAHRQIVLQLGAPNASGGSVYAERQGHPRIFLVGTGLLSALERVFYQADQLTRTQ